MVSDEEMYDPSKSKLWTSPEQPEQYIPLYLYHSDNEKPPGIHNYLTFSIGQTMITVSLAERSTLAEVIGNIASQMPENEERRYTADTYMRLNHYEHEYVVLMHPRDCINIGEVLAGFPEQDAGEFYFDSLIEDIKGGEIHLIGDDGRILWEWKGPRLLPVPVSTGPRGASLN